MYGRQECDPPISHAHTALRCMMKEKQTHHVRTKKKKDADGECKAVGGVGGNRLTSPRYPSM